MTSHFQIFLEYAFYIFILFFREFCQEYNCTCTGCTVYDPKDDFQQKYLILAKKVCLDNEDSFKTQFFHKARVVYKVQKKV